jgi:nucleoside 2-deoxyribosyltransferase
MKVYLAAQYARRDELRQYKSVLNTLGVEVTSRWLEEKEPLNSQMGQHSEEFYVETATIDLEDVEKADAVIFFSENPLVGVVRGGRHVEFGYAMKADKPIYVIGPKENVFHYIGRVYHFDTFYDFVETFKKYANVEEVFNGV